MNEWIHELMDDWMNELAPKHSEQMITPCESWDLLVRPEVLIQPHRNRKRTWQWTPEDWAHCAWRFRWEILSLPVYRIHLPSGRRTTIENPNRHSFTSKLFYPEDNNDYDLRRLSDDDYDD